MTFPRFHTDTQPPQYQKLKKNKINTSNCCFILQDYGLTPNIKEGDSPRLSSMPSTVSGLAVIVDP